jgi:ribose 5-phosphate isomerase A
MAHADSPSPPNDDDRANTNGAARPNAEHRGDAGSTAGADPDPLAAAAIAPIQSGMVVALGTGRAASRAIHALAARHERESLDLACVATSRRSAELAERLGLPIRSMRDVMEIDYLFDGADEVDPRLRLLKGAGGAMTREKVAAWASRTRVYLVQRRKLVDRLGETHRLPVEVLETALGVTTIRLEWLKLDPQLRMAGGEHGVSVADVEPGQAITPYRTDEGNVVIDIRLPDDRPPADADVMLRLMPGVVGHGLFLDYADHVLVEDEHAGARLTRLSREGDAVNEYTLSDPGAAPLG